MVTPSFIPSSATRGPDADLSFDEGFEEVLNNSEDEPIMKKRVSDSDKDDGGERKTEAMGMCLFPLSDLLSSFFFFFFFFLTYWYNSLIVLHINFP